MKHFFVLLSALATALALNQTLQEFTSGNNLLTSDIYRELGRKFQKNFLVSPFSLETILALTQSGAKDKTAEEIRTTLRLPNSKEETEAAIKEFLPKIKSQHFSVDSANKIYVKENYPIREEFKEVATEIFQADLENVDFENKAEVVKKINEWVEGQTSNKIHDVISDKDLDEFSRLVLINALYFKGDWSVPFKLISTMPRDFYKTEKEAIQVDTMKATEWYNYYECTRVDAKFLEIPFTGDGASMIIVLPNEKNGIGNLEAKIERVFTPRPFTNEYVEVALPKFKIETTIDFEKILKNMGMRKVFNESEVDLSGISGAKGELKVSSVIQKTFIDVSENGVEAAAATIVHVPIVISAALPNITPEPKLFIADHPFIFYIKVKGVVLFGGRVLVPE